MCKFILYYRLNLDLKKMALTSENVDFKNVANISFIYDLDTDLFKYSDHSLVSLFDGELTELSIAGITPFIHPEDIVHVAQGLTDLKAANFHGNIHFRLLLPKGEKWIRLTPFLFHNGTSIILGNVIDVTAEVNNIYSIEKYANKKNSTLNILAHDLRGPLGIAKTVTELLERKITDSESINQIHYISSIIKQSVDLITDLIEREFMETINVEVVKRRIDIASKAQEYIEEYMRAAKTLKRNFKFRSSSQEIFIQLDEAKIMQVFNNLFTNALKFTKEDGEIKLSIEEKDGHVLFEFTDNGIGIPAASLPLLFDKFTDARRVGLNGEPTIGVGLSIVKQIVDWHKGKISVKSEVDKGTTFYIEIPKED
jgi:two-component system sensor histidine kinase VicK